MQYDIICESRIFGVFTPSGKGPAITRRRVHYAMALTCVACPRACRRDFFLQKPTRCVDVNMRFDETFGNDMV